LKKEHEELKTNYIMFFLSIPLDRAFFIN